MTTCRICELECASIRSLSKHIRDKHKCSSKQYYDNYLTTEPAKCVVCASNQVSFINISSGYNQTCSHKCAGVFHRLQLSMNNEKHSKFKEKVSKNQKEIWETRVMAGDDIPIRNKIRKTTNSFYATLTKDQKIAKCGWLNKLPIKEKEEWIQTILLNTGCHTWWKTASDKEKQLVYEKRNASRIGIPLDEYRREIPLSKQSYYLLVGVYTTSSYFKHKDKIDPNGLRSDRYHLDHKYSIIRGYHDNIPPEVIGSIANLELIPATDNVRKSAKCSITIESLMEQYNATI